LPIVNPQSPISNFQHQISLDYRHGLPNADAFRQAVFNNERRTVTILVAAIKSFTKISKSVARQEVIPTLNRYFTAMEDAIIQNSGLMFQQINDQLTAVFGFDQRDHYGIFDALRAAKAMHQTVSHIMEVQALLRKETFTIGIGINTGDAVLARIGSGANMQYTAIGESAAIAVQLEGLSPGGGITIGEETYRQTHGLVPVEKKGLMPGDQGAEPVVWYEVVQWRS